MFSGTSMFALVLVSLAALYILINCFTRKIEVGGKEGGWKIPSSSDESLNAWAEKNCFKIGDILVFKYDKKKDSVLEVTKEDYQGCNTSKPITKYNDGESRVKLGWAGPFYFISGAKGHCKMGQKLAVVVLSTHGREGEPYIPSATSLAPEARSPEAPQKCASYGLRIEYFNLLCLGLACFALIGLGLF